MRIFFILLIAIIISSCHQKDDHCNSENVSNNQHIMYNNQLALTNGQMKTYPFLKEMYDDTYYPDKVVDKGKAILVNLCLQIEQTQPKNLDALYKLTQAVTNEFNELQEDFDANDSELETVARECIAANFEAIAKAYSFEDVDTEELIATRDW